MDKNKISINRENFETRNDESKNAIEIENLQFKYFNSDEFIFENLNLREFFRKNVFIKLREQIRQERTCICASYI